MSLKWNRPTKALPSKNSGYLRLRKVQGMGWALGCWATFTPSDLPNHIFTSVGPHHAHETRGFLGCHATRTLVPLTSGCRLPTSCQTAPGTAQTIRGPSRQSSPAAHQTLIPGTLHRQGAGQPGIRSQHGRRRAALPRPRQNPCANHLNQRWPTQPQRTRTPASKAASPAHLLMHDGQQQQPVTMNLPRLRLVRYSSSRSP